MSKLKTFFSLIIFCISTLDLFAQNVYEAWVARYDGPVTSSGEARALAVDGVGNVYVTGSSYGTGTDRDYATIKYAPNGDTLWIRRYTGPGSSTAEATALAVDKDGNLYVTGWSGTYDGPYVTIKYAPNGDTLWVRSYNGPAFGPDRANALAVDDSGNVYVTGGSWGSSSGPDYATIKYAPNGDTLWLRRYNGPGGFADEATAITVDGDGNVIVTGRSDGSGTGYDYATIKYAANGDTLWVRCYNGPLNSWDQASAVVVDDSGNVYVTGRSPGSGTGYDYTTIKYAPNGDTLWVRRYNGLVNDDDYANALAVDDSGNVYVTGSSHGAPFDFDYTTIKYGPNGDTLWVRRYAGQGNGFDAATAIQVDGNGNVYVTGRSLGVGAGNDYITIKYAPNGDTLWVRRYNSSVNGDDYANALVVDVDGNVYVTGSSSGGYTTIKYATNGDTIWTGRYSEEVHGNDYAYAVAVGGIGDVYVTGGSGTIKYSVDGDLLWFGTHGGNALAVDGSNNVYVTGSGTIKYSADGDFSLVWLS